MDVVELEPRFTVISQVYFFVALIGFYTTFLFIFNKKLDFIAKWLVGLLLFINSVFIFHIGLYISNCLHIYPNLYGLSAPFSLLYGPLFYFLYKRITQRSSFRKVDLLHLVPTMMLFFLLIPEYIKPEHEKLELIMYLGFTSVELIVAYSKTASLLIYTMLTFKILLRLLKSKTYLKFEVNLFLLHACYAVCYVIYASVIANLFPYSRNFLHLPALSMSLIVLFIAHITFMQFINTNSDALRRLRSLKSLKYQKSTMTERYSLELTEALHKKLFEKKLYKKDNLSLDELAEELNTSRHNASQLINERFGTGFFDVINHLRILEVMHFIKTDKNKDTRIIDIAYDCGYSNKSTFNKAFKKITGITPVNFRDLSEKQSNLLVEKLRDRMKFTK